ncbi:MAG: DNA repair protein RecO [Spirochaetota bacterium]|nr:MAG: DNA repair protein RecO [Spirochaetota bacterium]
MKSRYIKTEGIILTSVNFGEGHKIIKILTDSLGKIETSAFGVRKTKSRFGSKLEPFTHTRLMLYRKSEDGLFTINDAEAISHNSAIREDFQKYVVGNAVIEPVVRFVETGNKDTELFNLVVDSLNILNDISNNKTLYLLSIYDLKFLAVMGYRQQTALCMRCGNPLSGDVFYMDSHFGFPICESCKSVTAKKVAPSAVKFVDWATGATLTDAGRVTMSEETLTTIRELIEYLYIAIYNRGLESWKQLLNQGGK